MDIVEKSPHILNRWRPADHASLPTTTQIQEPEKKFPKANSSLEPKVPQRNPNPLVTQ